MISGKIQSLINTINTSQIDPEDREYIEQDLGELEQEVEAFNKYDVTRKAYVLYRNYGVNPSGGDSMTEVLDDFFGL